jgi:hypothetical protein
MNIKTYQSQIRTLKQGDPRFNIVDKFVTAPRAGFEISKECPHNHTQAIMVCIERGWLKPVAHVHERELIFMGLNNDNN